MAVRDEVPGGIITVMPTKPSRHACLAGNVVSMRADVEARGVSSGGASARPAGPPRRSARCRGSIPGDNQGARFELAPVEAGEMWIEMESAGR